MVYVYKRDNTRVIFDANKIEKAIEKASFECGVNIGTTAKDIANEIYETIKNYKGDLTVETVQDYVEFHLMNSNYKEVAKAYILYRNKRNENRKSRRYNFLSDEFLSKYKKDTPPLTDFGHFVYLRTYSRWLEDEKRREDWWETVARSVDYNMSLVKNSTTQEAELLYDNIFNLRQFLSGRTTFTGGTEVSKLYPTSNFNCAFTVIDNFKAYEDMFYLSMVGSGVGFRVLEEDAKQLPKVRTDIRVIHQQYVAVPKGNRDEITSVVSKDNGRTVEIVIGDSKEGWVQSLESFLAIFYSNRYKCVNTLILNYNNIRPFGEKLITFGGTASGHLSMLNMFTKMTNILTKDKDKSTARKLKTIDAMDLANIIAENVVSGSSRRSAQICLFGADDKDILNAKSELYTQDENGKWSINKDISHRQMSNNSIFYTEKPTDEQIKWQIKQMRFSGEPGFYSGQAVEQRRPNGKGTNPCGEILLDSNGMCNLTTINMMAFVKDGELDIEGLLTAQRLSARAGYRMATIELELPQWNAVQQRDRLIGCSFTGYQDMVNATGMTKEQEIELLSMMRLVAQESGNELADSLGENKPLLVTTIKPEGTLSCLPTVSSGIHYSHSPFYVRRVRVTAQDPLVRVCEELGYPVYPEVGQEWETCSTKVVEFPVKAPVGRTKYDVSALEQLENYAMTMEHYTDHNTSITVSVRNHEWTDVENWIIENWEKVIGISFLSLDDNFYNLLPFEAITEEEYNERVANMKPFSKTLLNKFENETLEDNDVTDTECASGACPVR